MASNMPAKVNETRSGEGTTETRVQTVDHQSPAGHGQGQGQMERQRNVEVIHQQHPSEENSGPGHILAGATTAVVNSIQTVKDAISEKSKK